MTQTDDERADADDVRERGLGMMAKVYGWKVPADMPGDHFAFTMDHLFATIWTRPGLSLRDRRLLLLGALTAQGAIDVASIQMTSALQNGEFDEAALREIALFLCHYVGWPMGTKLDAAVGSVVAEAKKRSKRDREQPGDAARQFGYTK
jgi:4-carboxymuconolactone decarboxylase